MIGPVLGPVLNLALSPIEQMLGTNVTGTLNDPEMELKHIPKVLLVPVQLPFKLIDELVLDGESTQHRKRQINQGWPVSCSVIGSPPETK